MGYAAIVKCNCYREGKTIPAPHQEYLRVDETGWVYLDVDDLNLPKTIRDAWFLEFDQWEHAACAHENMEYTYAHLQNSSGMGSFQRFLAEIDAPLRYPLLATYLPNSEAESFPAAYATAGLAEVHRLRLEPTQETNVRLIEEKSGKLIAETCSQEVAVFRFTPRGPHYALHADGFFLFEDSRRRFFAPRSNVVFKSMHFVQIQLTSGACLLTDIATDRAYLAPDTLMLPGDETPAGTLSFRVDVAPVLATTQHAYILNALERVLQASVETSNPVLWA
ncbi:hypothetical protein [Hymenobacter koreensis]|uniref:Uncharacterized protein n=1 Tax=Hymenobacter koreensis TaxID=1084523 RepID=A0ABP8IU71_9BACT